MILISNDFEACLQCIVGYCYNIPVLLMTATHTHYDYTQCEMAHYRYRLFILKREGRCHVIKAVLCCVVNRSPAGSTALTEDSPPRTSHPQTVLPAHLAQESSTKH